MSGGGAEFQFATELPTATFAIVVWILPVPGLPPIAAGGKRTYSLTEQVTVQERYRRGTSLFIFRQLSRTGEVNLRSSHSPLCPPRFT